MSSKEGVSMKYHNVSSELESVIKEFFNTKEQVFAAMIEQIVLQLRSGCKILVYGNGGSASQAQHFAAELVNKFLKKRSALPAIALTTDTSALTSIANDEAYDQVFSRQLEALGKEGDISLGLSTSGNSPSVIKAMDTSRKNGLLTIALTGEGGGQLADKADYLLDVPSGFTPRIQEVHLVILHLMAQEIEERMF